MNLPEYENNEYIAGLPGIVSPQQTFELLSRPPSWEKENLQLPPVFRRHCVQRLKGYFRPSSRHVMFAEEFGMMLRNGYLDRDPSNGRHEVLALQVAEQVRDGSLLVKGRAQGLESNADCGVLVGMPGMGKTLTVKEVLRTYPQIIEHNGIAPQITYLRLDTPAKGSPRGLCVAFFSKVDELLGQSTYTRLYAGQHATEETMLHNMALVARYHGLGCLVVDEIQHLPRGGEQDHALLTFLVTLANTVGVPVLFIGTMKAMKLFEGTARMARRSVGNFGGSWEHYKASDGQWRDFLDDLWQYQWTTCSVKLDEELRSVIYDETQGVVDLAVKLIMRVQMRLILRTEINPTHQEKIEPSFIRKIAQTDFKPVHGFLDALRSGDRDRINAYEDLSDFHAAFDATTEDLTCQPRISLSTRQRRDEGGQDVRLDASSPEHAVRADLRRRGIESDLIEAVIEQAMLDLGGEEPGLMVLIAKVERLLAPKGKKGRVGPITVASFMEGDLRQLAREATDAGRYVHEALAEAGIGGANALKLAA